MDKVKSVVVVVVGFGRKVGYEAIAVAVVEMGKHILMALL